MLYYVMTSCTSWCDVEKAINSQGYATRSEALKNCGPGEWVEQLTEEEANALTK
jgi:hypothetical protein